jgi:hypothetical protein
MKSIIQSQLIKYNDINYNELPDNYPSSHNNTIPLYRNINTNNYWNDALFNNYPSNFTLMIPTKIISDICIYGATSGGVIAAVRAAKMGKTVSLVSQNNYFGGLTTGGLTFTDLPYDAASDNPPTHISGDVLDFYKKINHKYYSMSIKPTVYYKRKGQYVSMQVEPNTGLFFFEPHIAKEVFSDLLNSQPNIKVYYNKKITSVTMNGTQIKSISMLDSYKFTAKMFIDCSYEGDLLKYSGVHYTMGRESSKQYGESLAGMTALSSIARDSKGNVMNIDAYKIPGDKSSGFIVKYVNSNTNYKIGDSSPALQTYNYRLCITNNQSKMIPFSNSNFKPPNYNSNDYKILFRLIDNSGLTFNHNTISGTFPPLPFTIDSPAYTPNSKIDYNVDPFLSGMNKDYLEDSSGVIDYNRRKLIEDENKNYTKGIYYTLATHSNVPENIRNFYSKIGLAADEFTDNNNWPTELYVREGRRMVSDYVITRNNCSNTINTIATYNYDLDIHNAQFMLKSTDTNLYVEGGVGGSSSRTSSLIPYNTIIPPANKCTNLLVTFSISSSHVSFCTIRLEPCFMQIAQAAATAACLCIDNNYTVQNLPYTLLKPNLYTIIP